MCQKRLFYNLPFFVIVCFFQALYGFLSVTIALVLNYFIDVISTADTEAAIIKIGIISIAYTTIYAGSRAIADSLAYSYCNKSSEYLKNDIFKAVLSMKYSEFSKKDSGDYLNQILNDVRMINDNFYIQIFSIVTFASQFLFCVIYSVYINVAIALILFVLTVLQTLVPVIFGKSLNSSVSKVSTENASFTSKIKELLLGFEVIKSYGCEKNSQSEFEAYNKTVTSAQRKNDVIKQIMMCSNLLLAWLIIFSAVITAGILVLNGKMTIANLFAAFYLANHYTIPVMHFFSSYTMVKANKCIRTKIDNFISQYTVTEKTNPISMKQSLNINNLSFNYTDGSKVIDDVTFEFKKGKKYLILGESGCGKSTLLKIIAGFYDHKSIWIDNNPDTINSKKSILFVGQQPYLFNKSIRKNIDLLETEDDLSLSKTIEECALCDFINTLADKENTIVNEEVNRTSGGQKARIGLARALYNKPEILLIDEVTSSLDNETAYKIEKMLLSLKDVLIIHVTHKPFDDLILQYDEVITMKNGKFTS